MGRAISIAVKLGGSPDPDSNYKLRMAIDAARSANMPKDNIQRAINKAAEEKDLEQVLYEGFGPGGVAVIVDVATSNRNRTGQEIKIYSKKRGSLGGPGSVSYNFMVKV
jgi:transcriptional/translational regulatory protein YebC/TACO1